MIIYHPTETQPSDWTMLRDAAEQWEYFRIASDDYTAKEHDPPVDPDPRSKVLGIQSNHQLKILYEK